MLTKWGTAPTRCYGETTDRGGVPICDAHYGDLVAGRGQFYGRRAAIEWLEVARHVHYRLPTFEPDQRDDAAPWVDWSKPGNFAWVGGKGPMWESDDSRDRVDGDREIFTPRSKPPKKAWNPRAWWKRKAMP